MDCLNKSKDVIIIGSSKIAKIHYNYLSENKFKKFYFVGRTKSKINKFIKKYNIKYAYFRSKKSLSKNKKIISVCNNTDFHQDYLDYIPSSKHLIMVEKPLISIKVFRDIYKEKIIFYFKKFKKLIVIYPMIFLASSVVKYIKNKKINTFKIYYYTKGNNRYDDIYIDLLPHCLIFFRELCRLKNKNLGPLLKIKKKINKHNNNIELVFKNIKLYIYLKEKYKGKNSKFFFQIDKTKYYRVTKDINGEFKNFIKIKNKIFEIKNPMRQFFTNTFLNINKKIYFSRNKFFTLWLSNLTYKIFNS